MVRPWAGAQGRGTPPGNGLHQPSTFISRALSACLCWVDTAQWCYSFSHGPDTFSRGPGTLWPC